MGRILLVRHGQASLLADDYDRLSPLGERQAGAVGTWLRTRLPAPAAVLSGRLLRQRHSAERCLAAAGWDNGLLGIDSGFDEYGHHELFAATYPELADPAALAAHLRAHPQPRHAFHAMFERAFTAWVCDGLQPEGGMAWVDFRARCTEAVRRVARACGSGRTALVHTSGGVIAAICQALLDVPDRAVLRLHAAVHNASITTLLSRGGEVSVSSFNSTAHLEADPGAGLISYR